MSAEATFWAWMMGVKPSTAKLVLLCLADCHNPDNGRCDPSNAYITQFTGLDRKTVIDALKMLEMIPLVEITQRRGRSPQYHLLIHENPVPSREKGERKKPVKVRRLTKANLSQIRAIPNSGYPESGSTENGTPTYPKYGRGGIPNTGHEPTSNLPDEPTSYSDTYVSAPGGADSVDNSLQALGEDYQSPSAEKLIFERGVHFLTSHPAKPMTEEAARKVLGMVKREVGVGRALDAVVTSIIASPPGCPKSYLLGVMANQPYPLPENWQPDPGLVGELQSLGMPDSLIRDARDVFVVWFRSQEIEHGNWHRLFREWCQRDWERAEAQQSAYRRQLAASTGAGIPKTFQEAP